MLIDTHAHLYWDSFKDNLDKVIDHAANSGVGTIINIGTDPQTNLQALMISSDKIKLYSSVGLHPHEGSEESSLKDIDKLIVEMKKLYQQNPQKIVAIGECGLDFYFDGNRDFTPSDKSTKEVKGLQMKLYKTQIQLAKKLNLPLIIHCREAWDDIFLKELTGTTGLFHSFTGNLANAQQALQLGFFLSFSCIITYPKNQTLREAIKQIPLDKILTETDSPFLPPQPLRGQRNEPANVSEVVKVIAQIKGISDEEVAKQVYSNSQELFKIA